MTTPHDAEEAMRAYLAAKYEADIAVKNYAGNDVREYAHLLTALERIADALEKEYLRNVIPSANDLRRHEVIPPSDTDPQTTKGPYR